MEVGDLGAAVEHPLFAHIEFVLQDDFQELFMAEAAGSSLLQADAQAVGQAREAELFECGFQVGDAH